jgi:hypothetical protein
LSPAFYDEFLLSFKTNSLALNCGDLESGDSSCGLREIKNNHFIYLRSIVIWLRTESPRAQYHAYPQAINGMGD